MKAITCSQCGALIKGITIEKIIVHCNYCDAEIPIWENRRKVFEIADPVPVSASRKPERDSVPIRITPKMIFAILGIFIVLPIVIAGSIFALVVFDEVPPRQKYEIKVSATTHTFDITKSGALKFNHIEYPEIEESRLLPHSEDKTTKELFDEKIIKVEVKIDDTGKITWSKALNGNDYARDLCEKAALKTTFTRPELEYDEIIIIYEFSFPPLPD